MLARPAPCVRLPVPLHVPPHLLHCRYASAACAARFELQNIFMPAARWLGQFDRVHVGASCPPDRLAPLLALLRPEGGLVVVPVAPNDLRVITKKASGAITQKVVARACLRCQGQAACPTPVTPSTTHAQTHTHTHSDTSACACVQVISQVRFSELEVPTDAEVLLATLRGERRQRTAPSHHPSTYAEDVAAIVGGAYASATPAGSYGDACGAFMPSTSPSAGTRRRRPRRLSLH